MKWIWCVIFIIIYFFGRFGFLWIINGIDEGIWFFCECFLILVIIFGNYYVYSNEWNFELFDNIIDFDFWNGNFIIFKNFICFLNLLYNLNYDITLILIYNSESSFELLWNNLINVNLNYDGLLNGIFIIMFFLLILRNLYELFYYLYFFQINISLNNKKSLIFVIMGLLC